MKQNSYFTGWCLGRNDWRVLRHVSRSIHLKRGNSSIYQSPDIPISEWFTVNLMGYISLCIRPLPHGWSSSRPQSSPTQIRTPPCPAENAALSISQQISHLIFMAISTGQLDIGEQKMVLLIAGVSSQDQPEKESMSCQPEPVRLGCMPRLGTSWWPVHTVVLSLRFCHLR